MSEKLSERAVDCKHWRWLPGMLGIQLGRKWRRDGHQRSSKAWVSQGHSIKSPHNWEEVLPDLTDPATVGCLLALVREAYRCPTLHAWYSRQLGCWVVSVNGQEIDVQESSEARALVAALEAAP